MMIVETLANWTMLDERLAGWEPVEWLWPGWIARGRLALLSSVPGTGKTLLALDLARRVAAGEALPDGLESARGGEGEPGDVVYVDGDNRREDITIRLAGWRTGRDRLRLLRHHADLPLDFTCSDAQDRLAAELADSHPALLVIDSLATVSRYGDHDTQATQHVLQFLDSLAVCYNCAVLVTHNLYRGNRWVTSSGLRPSNFRGSEHITRAVWTVLGLSTLAVGPEPDRNGPRRLDVVMTRMGYHPPPLGMALAEPAGRSGSLPEVKYGIPLG